MFRFSNLRVIFVPRYSRYLTFSSFNVFKCPCSVINFVQYERKIPALFFHPVVLIQDKNHFGTSTYYNNKQAIKEMILKPSRELDKGRRKFLPSDIAIPQDYRGPKGIFFRFIEKMLSKRGLERTRKLAAAYYTYESYIDLIDIEEFFIEFDLPDTFASWFAIVEMHVWAMSARLMTDDDETSYKTRDMFVEAFWVDADTRSQRLGPRATLYRKKHLMYLASAFQAAFFGYDEGIQSNDMVLAAMIWRRIFGRECTDAAKIERLVKYLRVQVDHLSMMSIDDITKRRSNLHVPLSEVHIESDNTL